ncbi:MAG: hypothetical protein LKI82_06540 [Clostridium sp.]|jgi:hypothetical protein|uniref:hypothetical protein n=1 Tax=Clostridium sp. TaxID=1506 RepID=UPI0025C6253D|nr:hypothetical protein [Clostridium sp.]MCI1870562.1 hypothetical protein [Clostridium sp.]
MIIITFQNLFDTNFNIASKIKILILSVFSGLSWEKCIINFAFYVFSWIILLIFLIYNIDNYMKNSGIKNINYNVLISLIMIIIFIIIFIIYVYGINNPYVKCRRKLLLYSISTIVASVSTINSIEGMYKNNFNYVDIFNFQFILLLFALILSVDKVMENFTILFKEYNNSELVISSKICENCIILSVTFPVVRDKIKSYVINFVGEVKKTFTIYKGFNFGKKLLVIICFIFSIVFLIFVLKLEYLLESKSGIIMFKFTDVIRNMFYSFNELVGYKISNILWMILVVIAKVFLVVLIIIISIFCLIYIGDTGLSIIGIFKDSFSKKSYLLVYLFWVL